MRNKTFDYKSYYYHLKLIIIMFLFLLCILLHLENNVKSHLSAKTELSQTRASWHSKLFLISGPLRTKGI